MLTSPRGHGACLHRQSLNPTTVAAVIIAILLWRLAAFSLSGASLYVDEAQYWVWAQDLSWGYFSKPPGIAALIAASTYVFGDSPLGVKALAMLSYLLSALLCGAIARRLFNPHVAMWTTLITLTLPAFAWLGLFASTDALLTLCWLLALHCYLSAIATPTPVAWLKLGIACGLGLLSKYTMLAFVLGAFLHLLVEHRRLLATRGPWLAAGVALLLLAPNILWNITHDFPTLRHTADITLQRQHADGWNGLLEFIAAQWLCLGPVLGSLGIYGLIHAWRHHQPPDYRLLILFSLPLWLLVCIQAWNGGANANWAAPALAPASIALVAALLAQNRPKLLIAALVSNLLLVAVVYHAPQLLSTVDSAKSTKFNPYIRAMGWAELAAELRPIALRYPEAPLLADNRTVLSHMRYELRDLNPQVISWNPQGIISDHYRLTTDLNQHTQQPVLLLTESPPNDSILTRFAQATRLAGIDAPLGPDQSRHLEVYLLHGFKGY